MSRWTKAVAILAGLVALALVACMGGPVKVGAVLPLTGPYALYGVPIKKGIDLAYEEIQKSDDRVQLELEVRDSGSNPDRSAELLEELYKGGAVAAIGGVTTEAALKMVPVAERADKVLLSPSASSPALTGISRDFFRIYPSDFREGNKMGNFAADTLGIDRMVILASESAYASGISDVFQTQYRRYGGEVVDVIEYPAEGADIAALVDRALEARPVGIYIADYAPNVSKIIKELRSRDFEGKILTTSAYASSEVIAEAGADAEGVLLPQTAVPADDPTRNAFLKAYKEKYGEEPNVWAAHGYDSMKVLAEAIAEGGHLPSDVWKGMRGIHGFLGATGVIQFDEKGDVGKFPRTYVIENGQLVDYEKAVDDKRQEILRRIEELNRSRARSAAGGSGSEGN